MQDLLNIGFIAFILVAYFFTRFRTTNYFFNGYNNAMYILEYATISFLPLPILRLLEGKLDPKFDKIISFSIHLLYFSFFSQLLLTLFNILEFKDVLPFLHLMLFFTSIVAITTIVFSKGSVYPKK